MKFFTVLAWASLALATPTPAIQTRDEDNALCKIFDSLSKLEDTVYASKVKIGMSPSSTPIAGIPWN
jgi:hypothetical protein